MYFIGTQCAPQFYVWQQGKETLRSYNIQFVKVLLETREIKG